MNNYGDSPKRWLASAKGGAAAGGGGAAAGGGGGGDNEPAFKSYSNALFFDEDGTPRGMPDADRDEDYGKAGRITAGGQDKLQAQRAAAAAKRIERLQMSGVATSSGNAAPPPAAAAPGRDAAGASGSAWDGAAAPRIPAPGGGGGGRHSPGSSVSSVEELDASPAIRPTLERHMSTNAQSGGARHRSSGGAAGNGPPPAADMTALRRPPGGGRPAPVRPVIHDMRAFLMQPGPRAGPIQCFIRRDKGASKMYPAYKLFLEDGAVFLLSARKRKKSRSSNYVISVSEEDTEIT